MKSIVHASARQGLRATSDSLTTRDGREVSVEAQDFQGAGGTVARLARVRVRTLCKYPVQSPRVRIAHAIALRIAEGDPVDAGLRLPTAR